MQRLGIWSGLVKFMLAQALLNPFSSVTLNGPLMSGSLFSKGEGKSLPGL